jgi:hypothetical protein
MVAGLGVLHSVKRAFALAATLVLFQMADWMAIGMIAGVGDRDEPGDWRQGFSLGFFISLLYALPYTAIGAVTSGTTGGLLRRRTRRDRDRISWPTEHPSGRWHTGSH